MEKLPKGLELSRRDWLLLMAGIFTGALGKEAFDRLTLFLSSQLPLSEDATTAEPQSIELPSPESIINRIKELDFLPGSELRTTVLLRKIAWEMIQVLKMQGRWDYSSDESDWYSQPEIMAAAVADLAAAGIKGARLAIFNFELTQNGEEYNWSPMEAGIDLMVDHGIAVDLCLGPLDYPYDPGFRLPIQLENRLKEATNLLGKNHFIIELNPDPNAPEYQLVIDIRDFALNFLAQMLDRYGDDPRIDTFYLGNEWPDTHGVEGTNATLSISTDLMTELVRHCKAGTAKKIGLNTNIHPSRPHELREKLGPFLDILGNQAVLGLDTYPTRETEDSVLVTYISQYEAMVAQIQADFPEIEVVFTEFQAEPWPPEGIAGQSWAQIWTEHPEIMQGFFQRLFPPMLETHVIPSQIKEVGLWGAPAWLVAKALGYEFPNQMMSTIAETMNESE